MIATSVILLLAQVAVPPSAPPTPRTSARTAVGETLPILSREQESAPVTAMIGQPVVNANGNVVGRVLGTDGYRIVIDTGAQRMAYPTSRFKPGQGAVVFDLTQAQVDAEALRSQSDPASRMASALIPGAAVRDPSGAMIGTIYAMGPTGVTVSGGSTKTVVPTSAFSMDANGGLVIPVSSAEFSAPR